MHAVVGDDPRYLVSVAFGSSNSIQAYTSAENPHATCGPRPSPLPPPRPRRFFFFFYVRRCTGWFSFNPIDSMLADPECKVGECPTCTDDCVYNNDQNNSFLFNLEEDPYEMVRIRGIF